ncbi:MAG: 50S ribosomal protein L35 [Dehalococcoidia bacterium]
MPKLKTHKGAKRRFKITGTGKILMAKGNKRHKKSAKSKRVLHSDDKMRQASPGQARRIKRLLPYSF